MMESLKSLDENDDLEACDRLLEIFNLSGVMALSDNFTVAASKCRSNGKHHKSS